MEHQAGCNFCLSYIVVTKNKNMFWWFLLNLGLVFFFKQVCALKVFPNIEVLIMEDKVEKKAC